MQEQSQSAKGTFKYNMTLRRGGGLARNISFIVAEKA